MSQRRRVFHQTERRYGFDQNCKDKSLCDPDWWLMCGIDRLRYEQSSGESRGVSWRSEKIFSFFPQNNLGSDLHFEEIGQAAFRGQLWGCEDADVEA